MDRRLYENPQAFNWGIVILYSIETAEPLALLHEFYLSGMRVGATTGMAVDQVARKDAATLGLFGTGKQARSAFEAIALVRPIRRVNVYSPSAEHRTAFARDMARDGIEVVAVAEPRAAVAGADVVCCCTTAMKPVFDGDWLEDGQFVVSIANSDVTNKRSEVDRRTYERASAIIVNDWESVIDNDQSELLDPIAQGVIRREQVHELGALVNGTVSITQPRTELRGTGNYLLQEQLGPRDPVRRGRRPALSQGDGARQQQDHPDRMAGEQSRRVLQRRIPALALIGDR